MDEAIRDVLVADQRIGYALIFGSRAAGRGTAFSDVDVAIGITTGARLDRRSIGELMSQLEGAAKCAVDLVVLDHAPPALAYRIFRDGRVLFEADHAALVRHKTRAILEYLDFRPVEQMWARAVLDAAANG